ncbi:MAG: glycosyltransferase family 4 protein [Deltaproteobacteria bacterium]|nr:glycosyltransferase family 4 protein [Deltaproteobacteria bacterium]
MRILYSHRIQSHDGQGVHVEELVKAFRQTGNDVLVIGPTFYDSVEFGQESWFIAAMRRIIPSVLMELAEIAYNIPCFLRLRHACKQFGPDFVYERYNLFYLAGVLLKRRYGIPFYLEVNSPLAEERAHYGGLRLRHVARMLQSWVWRSADRIFVVSGVLGEMVVAAGVERERVTVVPNGVDLDRFSMASYRSRTDHWLTVGFVGFVRDWHGIEMVISGLAAERASLPVRLEIVGPTSQLLANQAEQLGVADLVNFRGLAQTQAIPNVIRSFDIAVQPRAVAYASPLKLFEYMACGRAIVAPDQANIREILVHNETAILFDPEDPGALWHAIRRLAIDVGLRDRLGRAARKALENRNYTWQGNASRIIDAAVIDLAQSGGDAPCLPHFDRSVSHGSR